MLSNDVGWVDVQSVGQVINTARFLNQMKILGGSLVGVRNFLVLIYYYLVAFVFIPVMMIFREQRVAY